jgi:hypothetical protein
MLSATPEYRSWSDSPLVRAPQHERAGIESHAQPQDYSEGARCEGLRHEFPQVDDCIRDESQDGDGGQERYRRGAR